MTQTAAGSGLLVKLPQHGDNWPFIDTLESLDAEARAARCSYLYSGDEVWEAASHLRDLRVLPGICLQEGMALTLIQLGQVLPELAGQTVRYTGCDGFRIKRAVMPGQRVFYTAEIEKIKTFRGTVFGHGSGRAEVEGQLVAEVASIHFATGNLDG